MSVRISGNLYNGKDAKRTQATIRCEPDGHLYFENGALDAVHIDDIEISDPIGSIPRTLRFPNGELFETNEHKKLSAWLGSTGRTTGFLHKLESNWRFVVTSVAGLALFLFVVARWGIPAASEIIAARLPDEISAYIGAGTLEALDENLFEPSALSNARQNELRQDFLNALPEQRKSTEQSAESGIRYALEFRAGGPIGANAFALPDGTIVITDELLALAKNNEEVLAVLLHEMGHVEKRHSLRMVISHSGLAVISLAIIGDISSAGALVLALPSVLVESSYSRDFEIEADDYALARLKRLNISPSHFANLMLRLERCGHLVGEDFQLEDCDVLPNIQKEHSANTLVNYLSTHPSTEGRIAKFLNTP
ncbi:MAG: M48 family metallopeptidase [Gammaproteobacteria bacterium]